MFYLNYPKQHYLKLCLNKQKHHVQKWLRCIELTMNKKRICTFSVYLTFYSYNMSKVVILPQQSIDHIYKCKFKEQKTLAVTLAVEEFLRKDKRSSVTIVHHTHGSGGRRRTSENAQTFLQNIQVNAKCD